MLAELIRKLEVELSAGITTEAQVVYLMVGIRKLIEQEGSADQYPSLLFHADWALHSRMERSAAKAILQQFDAAHVHLRSGIELHKLPPPLKQTIDRISAMKEFEKELTAFLSSHSLPELTLHRPDGWIHFLHLYAQVIEDCPLIAKGNSLTHILQVTVHLEMAREAVEHTGYQEMPFRVTWRVQDKNEQFGDITIYNSFSVVRPAQRPSTSNNQKSLPVELDDGQAYEEQVFREYFETFPRKGDRLFVETPQAIPVDPLGWSNPLLPDQRSLTGRRNLYYAGFLLAGDRLVSSLTGAATENSLLYPILFVYRQCLELKLKGLLGFVIAGSYSLTGFDQLAMEKEIKKSTTGTHRLQVLWKRLQQRNSACETWADPECRNAFQSLLLELDEHDPESQAFRYEVDSRGNPTLGKLHYVDTSHVQRGMHKLNQYLDRLYSELIEGADGVESDGEP